MTTVADRYSDDSYIEALGNAYFWVDDYKDIATTQRPFVLDGLDFLRQALVARDTDNSRRFARIQITISSILNQFDAVMNITRIYFREEEEMIRFMLIHSCVFRNLDK